MALTRPRYSQIYDSDFKNSCRVATTTSVTLSGAAPSTVDDVSLAVNDRVLVRAQNTPSQNGIYRVSVVGTGNNGTWVRALDADTASKLSPGTSLSVEEGTTLAGKMYRMTTPGPIILGTTEIAWTDVSGGGGASTGGTNGQMQYNNSNALSGATYLYYNSSTGRVTANAGIGSTSSTTGTLVVTGGVGISENLNVSGTLNVITLGNFPSGLTASTVNAGTIGNVGATITGTTLTGTNATITTLVATNFSTGNAQVTGGSITGLSGGSGSTSSGSTQTLQIGSGGLAVSGDSYLANSLGIAQNLSVSGTTASTSTSTGALVVTGGVGVGGKLNVGANVTVTGDVLPSANITYNLGSASQRWKDLFLSGTTIDLNGARISSANGAITMQNSLGGSFSVTGSASGQSTGTFGNLIANSGIASTSTSTGALVVTGGAGISGDLSVGGTIYASNLLARGSTTIQVQDPLLYLTANVLYPWNYDTGIYSNSIGGAGNAYVHHGLVRNYTSGQWTFFSNLEAEPGATISWSNASILYDTVKAGALTLANSTASTSTTTGALVVGGGTGIAGATYIGGILNTAGATTLQSTLGVTGAITGSSTVSATQYTSTVATGTAPLVVSSTTAVTNLNADLWDGNHFSDYLNQAVKTTSAPTFAGITTSAAIVPNANLSINLGSTSAWFNTLYGVSTQAKYADLAEHYVSDTEYPPGTVVIFGGEQEITISTESHDTRIAGVISTNPAYLMNAAVAGLPVALQGRVPCQVQGPVRKGDVLVASNIPGVAQRIGINWQPGCVIGKALNSINTNTIETIEVVVGRF